MPVDTAAAHDEEASGNFLERLVRGFIGSGLGVPAPVPAEAADHHCRRIVGRADVRGTIPL